MSVILTCNAGSSNTKLAAFDSVTLERKGHIVTHHAAETVEWLCSAGTMGIASIGHRVVHGGQAFTQPVRVTAEVMTALESYIPLAPLHQPAALTLIKEVSKLYPAIPQIACFDTAFHHSMPPIEQRLPLPRHFHDEGIQRYGFHGLSYQHVAAILPQLAGTAARGRVIVAHLGGGSSACAMKNLQSVASTMGFSTLDGLMMGTRTGALDAGVVLHMLRQKGMELEEVEHLLYTQSGLLGVSGISADMRELTASERPEARDAVELYCYLAAKQIASLLPAIGGLDALVFTGGIGENSAFIRERITGYLTWLGAVSVYVVAADEEAVIAKACSALA